MTYKKWDGTPEQLEAILKALSIKRDDEVMAGTQHWFGIAARYVRCFMELMNHRHHWIEINGDGSLECIECDQILFSQERGPQ